MENGKSTLESLLAYTRLATQILHVTWNRLWMENEKSTLESLYVLYLIIRGLKITFNFNNLMRIGHSAKKKKKRERD